MITSRQNAKIQQVRRLLNQAQARREQKAFVAEGVRLVEEAWARRWPFHYVLYDETVGERGHALIQQLRQGGVTVEQVTPALMTFLSATETPQGLLAVLSLPPAELPSSLPAPQFLLVLDGVRDPGNVGALLRSAAAAGVQAVLLSPEAADPWQPKVVRAGMGAHFRLPLVRHPLPELAQRLPSSLKWVLAEASGAIPLWQADLRSGLALILGNEAHGASAWARQQAQERVYIPMPGGMESLNVAMAGAILLFEVVRQRWERR